MGATRQAMLKTAYWIVCAFIFDTAFIGLGYLMLFDPARYVDLWNWRSRKTGSEKRLSVERCSRIDHRAAGLFLLSFGIVMLCVEVKVFLSGR
jgi:hypothetical protein